MIDKKPFRWVGVAFFLLKVTHESVSCSSLMVVNSQEIMAN